MTSNSETDTLPCSCYVMESVCYVLVPMKSASRHWSPNPICFLWLTFRVFVFCFVLLQFAEFKGFLFFPIWDVVWLFRHAQTDWKIVLDTTMATFFVSLFAKRIMHTILFNIPLFRFFGAQSKMNRKKKINQNQHIKWICFLTTVIFHWVHWIKSFCANANKKIKQVNTIWNSIVQLSM